MYNESHGTYGSPRIYRELKDQVACSENRTARLMRLRGLRARQSKSFKTTTKRNKADPVAPNLLRRDFTADRPNQKAKADVFFCIESFYNRRRRHSALDDLSPLAYEQRFHKRERTFA